MSEKSTELLAAILDDLISEKLLKGKELDERIHEMLFQKVIDGDLDDNDTDV